MRKNKVAIAMSGGVDSSVAAALLKETGDFDLVGVFMRVHEGKVLERAEKRAKKVASYLKIPFHTIDLRKEFGEKVVKNCFLRGYGKGDTPNPCIVCNKEIKFGLLFKKSRSLGVRFLATGHYARIRHDENGYRLLKGRDREKDQSYFLWKLNQSLLKKILFPVGGYKKKEVRGMAKRFKLPISEFPESKEICFVNSDTSTFLKKRLKMKTGKIVSLDGKVLGEHQGLWFYTIGQRKRINVPQGPFYVIGKDFKKNILFVSKNKKDLYRKGSFLNQ